MVGRATCTVREQSRLPKCIGGGSRTSKGRYDPADISALLPNAGWLSCPVRPHQREVCSLAGRVMSPSGSTPIRPITGWPSLAPSSFTRCPVRSSYDSPCCRWDSRATGLPRSAGGTTRWFRSRLFAGGAPSAPEEFGASGPDHLPFWPKPNSAAALRRARLSPHCSSTFGLSLVTTFTDASPGLTLPPNPSPRPPWCWQSPCRLTLSRPPRWGEDTLSRELRTPPLPATHVPIGYSGQNRW